MYLRLGHETSTPLGYHMTNMCSICNINLPMRHATSLSTTTRRSTAVDRVTSSRLFDSRILRLFLSPRPPPSDNVDQGSGVGNERSSAAVGTKDKDLQRGGASEPTRAASPPSPPSPPFIHSFIHSSCCWRAARTHVACCHTREVPVVCWLLLLLLLLLLLKELASLSSFTVLVELSVVAYP
jgi:hypothetical protein